MATYSSRLKYIAWNTEVTPGTLLRTTPTFVRATLDQCTDRWVENQQAELVTTGDYFPTVDTIPNQPHAEITIVAPFFPSQLNTLFANCCLLTGASTNPGPLIPPVSTSIMIGKGLDEDGYAGCQNVGTVITIPQAGECSVAWRFIGSEKPAPNAVQTITLPAYERPYRKSNLQLATLIGSGTPLTEKKFNNLQINIVCDNLPLYDSRGDGLDGISEFALNELNATLTLLRRYQSATEKAKFLSECGAPGVITIKLATTCGASHSHTFNWPNAEYVDNMQGAPARERINETLTAMGLRNTANDTFTAYSPLQFTSA